MWRISGLTINCVKEYKNDIKNIKFPVFIIHGDDEIIPKKVVNGIMNRFLINKKDVFFYIQGNIVLTRSKCSRHCFSFN